jgi:hypothetical protein
MAKACKIKSEQVQSFDLLNNSVNALPFVDKLSKAMKTLSNSTVFY